MATNKGNTKTFGSVLYPDDPEYERTMYRLSHLLDEYTYITHDLDVNKETGEMLKPHTHFLWRYPEQRSIKTVSEELELPQNFIEKIHSYNNALVYLIHEKDSQKYQYSEDQVQGSAMGLAAFQKAIRQYRMKERTEDTRIMDIVNLISGWKGRIKYRELITECCNRGWYADLRRSGYLIQKLVAEHNDKHYGE